MSRKGENIYKRKDGRWEGRYKKGIIAGGKPFTDLATENHITKSRKN